jgi:Gram-negative bacterial TonB protein C-terminal
VRLFQSCMLLALSMAVGPGATAQDTAVPLPHIIQHPDPIYPQIARTAHIQGEVRVKISTNGESVTQAVAESGPELLRKYSEDNVRSWKFAPHTPGIFYVTFRYKFLSDDTEVTFLESPAIVQVAATLPLANFDDNAYIGLGNWNTEVKTAHGKAHLSLNLSYTGPEGNWLSGDARDPKGTCEEIDFGAKEGDMLAFTMDLADHTGRKVKTFFVGKMSARKILGTLVDENGGTGKWAATKTSDAQPGQMLCD